MYACILEDGRGFIEGCVLSMSKPAILLTHPLTIRRCLHASCHCLTRVLPLTAVNIYLLLPDHVLGNKLLGGEMGHPPLP